ncbi:MAG: hypothetical protein EPN99_06855 [Frankiales bacterium]|nr:MAG: hypothetical protein EPN99_06855 [Frankiales bacterium]
MSRTPRRAVALMAVGALAVVPLVGLSPTSATAAGAAQPLVCPPGMAASGKTVGERAQERKAADPAFRDLLRSLDDESAGAGGVCSPIREPEPFHELAAMQAERNVISAGPLGHTPAGAVRAALAGKQAATAAAPTVPGAQGTFTPLGTTPLLSDVEEYPSTNGSGLADLAGRVDTFAYDDVNRRLFAAPGTGGVWLSTDLGESWRSVGESMPYQSVGAVTWSPDGNPADGTLLVVSGEASAGGNVYTGIGAFYSTDSGRTWRQSAGVPDGLMGFDIEVDPTDPKVVYAATSQGLFRSADAGRTYANVNLPTGDCAGITGYGNICMNANWVTDVEVQEPGGTTDVEGGAVLAVVGYRAGTLPYPGTDTPQSPQNGLYRSDTGAVGSFTYLDDIYALEDGVAAGFAPQRRVGRTELGSARGPEQDHGYLYAIVQDAVLFSGGLNAVEAFDPTVLTGAVPNNTALNGIFVSPDFGLSWMRMADEIELQSPLTESALIGTFQATLYAPGIQSWYNMWIKPDPTTATAAGVPTRLVFGLEEVWESRLSGTPQDGLTQSAEPASFKVIGPYFADEACLALSLGLPVCPTTQTRAGVTTTHPDQQGGIWVPGDDGGVTLVVGHDGGVNTQTAAAGEALSKEKWGRGSQNGFNTLLPYHVAPAKDGTVWYGLQDNGSGKIEPGGRQIMAYGGDGFYVAVDPDDSEIAYSEHTTADMRVTQDGGRTWTSIAPPVSLPSFGNPFVMDRTDPEHLMTAGPEVVQRTAGPAGDWVEVFNIDEEGQPARQMSSVELYDGNAYVGYCQFCDIVNKNGDDGQIFQSGLATNVGGEEEPEKGSSAGWHHAAAEGLPDRYITSIKADPTNPRTIYVTLSGYANRQWWPVGSFNDKNPNVGEGHVFKSTDAGETFTDISGSLPDVPARWVEYNRGQLLVGTDVGVFLSNNTSGQRWAALEGLPNVPVTSLANVPGKPNEVVLSTFGRGVYTYTFSARAGASTPVTGPAAPARPSTGRLPATGLGVTAAAVGVLALLGGLAVRRRLTP